jgi:hypothetical protein
VACSRTAFSAICGFSPASIRPLVFFVIVRSVYQTKRPLSNLPPGPKNRVHFTDGPFEVLLYNYKIALTLLLRIRLICVLKQ